MEEQKNTKKPPIIIAVAIIIIAIILIIVFKNTSIIPKPEPNGIITKPPGETITIPSSTTTAVTTTNEWTGLPPNQTPSAKFKPGENIEIIYTDAGFAPQVLTVKQGKVVTFKNLSSSKMWPASEHHLTHEIYPTKGGCFNSTFDACRSLAPNESWSFKFDIPGTWQYHDHLNPSKTGTVVVEK